MVQQKVQVLVIGAGYAGLLGAVRLAMKSRHQNVQITLINPSEMFVERPRLHQFAANQLIKQRPISDVLSGTGVQFIQAVVTAIDVKRQEVIVQTDGNHQRLPYDYLLYTAGSTVDRDSIPGIRQYAYTLNPTGPQSAEALRSILPELNRQHGHLAVVGGGPTGIEAAAEFAESYPGLQVSLITQGELGGSWGGKIQSEIQQALARLGVLIRDQTTVDQVKQNEILTRESGSIRFDLCLWAGGFVALPLAKEAGLAVNERGQVLTDLHMRSISNARIYAAGDSAQPEKTSGIQVRMAAYTAAITGAHAADCLYDAIVGRRQKPLNFAYLGQGIALGRHNSVDFNNFPDDTPKWPIFAGELGVLGREFFVNLLADLPAIERRLPGLHFWPGRGKIKPVTRLNIGKEKRESGLLE
ncbi:MAG TPA: FAD-dependent oxidoreductase [Anaerolineales bacterium]|nr:FAD-dependent oxidoreductase [Anaerolineales bacterium]